MDIKKIKSNEPFNSIFPIEKGIFDAIKEDMEENGYDQAFPIVLWGDTIIDGHTRWKAAKMIKIDDVPVTQREFKDEKEALTYAIHNQRDRRNWSHEQIFRCIELVDERMSIGGDRKSKEFKNQNFLKSFGVSATETAQTVGVSKSTVEDVRAVLDCGDADLRERVEEGLSFSKGAKIARTIMATKKEEEAGTGESKTEEGETKLKKPSKSTFNYTNENIEWAKWTWNPITGCEHGCPYCYARDIANRYYKHGFEPHFYPNRLTAPENTKIPKAKKDESGIKNVFTVSMGDMMGKWVPKEWIEQIIKVMGNIPEWNYIILTKNPRRYLEFEWPDNCWLGATGDTQIRVNKAVEIFQKLEHPIKFLSCEPLMEAITLPDNPSIQWLIIGGRSSSSKMPDGYQDKGFTARHKGQPKWEWVESLFLQAKEMGIKRYGKPNLTILPKEYPE